MAALHPPCASSALSIFRAADSNRRRDLPASLTRGGRASRGPDSPDSESRRCADRSGFESDDCDFHIQISPEPRTSGNPPAKDDKCMILEIPSGQYATSIANKVDGLRQWVIDNRVPGGRRYGAREKRHGVEDAVGTASGDVPRFCTEAISASSVRGACRATSRLAPQAP